MVLCFKFNNFRVAIEKKLKFYTSVAKESKLKVRKFRWLTPMFVEFTGEKLVRAGAFCPSPILNRVNFSAYDLILSFNGSVLAISTDTSFLQRKASVTFDNLFYLYNDQSTWF